MLSMAAKQAPSQLPGLFAYATQAAGRAPGAPDDLCAVSFSELALGTTRQAQATTGNAGTSTQVREADEAMHASMNAIVWAPSSTRG
jgi:hypothetical protein